MNLFELEDYLKEKQLKGDYIGNAMKCIEDLKEIFNIKDMQYQLMKEEI